MKDVLIYILLIAIIFILIQLINERQINNLIKQNYAASVDRLHKRNTELKISNDLYRENVLLEKDGG